MANDADKQNPKPIAPGELLREMLQKRGWKQEDLALVTGRSVTAINNVITGRSGVTPDMAACLGAAFGNDPEEWLKTEASYRLSLITTDTSEIEERARLYSIAPVRDMQRRGWIEATDDLNVLRSELARFYGSDPNALGGEFSVAARRSGTQPNLNPAEKAWCFRAKQLAGTLPTRAPFSEQRLGSAKRELRRLATHPKEARHLPPLFSEYGIRFIIVEPLGGARIDGAAFWDSFGPVIAVSLRHDRVDGFWFTVMHEFSHVLHGDPTSIDTELLVNVDTGLRVNLADDEVEQRANAEAASSLIPTSEIESFISRVGPLYARERVIQFANRIRIHPGIIVGQLQYREQIGYRSMREFLVPIRENVISTALTDGWGQAISPAVTRSYRKE